MPPVLITHRAEPLDPGSPDGPARTLCGLEDVRGLTLVENEELVTCTECRRMALFPLTPVHRENDAFATELSTVLARDASGVLERLSKHLKPDGDGPMSPEQVSEAMRAMNIGQRYLRAVKSVLGDLALHVPEAEIRYRGDEFAGDAEKELDGDDMGVMRVRRARRMGRLGHVRAMNGHHGIPGQRPIDDPADAFRGFADAMGGVGRAQGIQALTQAIASARNINDTELEQRLRAELDQLMTPGGPANRPQGPRGVDGGGEEA